MVLALTLPGAIVTLSILMLCVRLRVGRRPWPAMMLRALSPKPLSRDASLVPPRTGGPNSALVAGAREPLGNELCALPADGELPTERAFRAQLLWVKRYSGHLLVDLYVATVAPVCPAASLLCMLPASPWSSWRIYWLLRQWAVESRVAQVEMTAGTACPLVHVSCDRFNLVLALDPWPVVHR